MLKQTGICFEYACLLALLICKTRTVAIICGNTGQTLAFTLLAFNILFFKKGSLEARAGISVGVMARGWPQAAGRRGHWHQWGNETCSLQPERRVPPR